jgi:hypothetical protein
VFHSAKELIVVLDSHRVYVLLVINGVLEVDLSFLKEINYFLYGILIGLRRKLGQGADLD